MKRAYGLLAILTLAGAGMFLLEGDSRGLPANVEMLIDDPVSKAIDEASFQRVKLLDRTVDFPLPTAESETKLRQLADANRSEPRYLKALADAQIALGRFAEAERTMITLADNHPDPETGLKMLADFYHGRLVIDREARTLQRLAERQNGDAKIATLSAVLDLQANFLLRDVNRVDTIRMMIAARPDDATLVFQLVDELLKQKRYNDALGETDAALRRFPERRGELLPRKANILVGADRQRDALAVYDIDFDPANDLELFESYLELLRSTGGYVRFERELNRNARLGKLDERGFQRHVLLMRSQRKFDEAERSLDRWIKMIGRLSPARMKTFADTFAAIGRPATAWRLFYSRYVAADEAGREDALADLAAATAKLGADDPALTAGGFGSVLSSRHFDTGPGTLGGLLSLFYNNQDLGWRLSDLQRVIRQQEHARLYLALHDRFAADYPSSRRLAALSSGAVRLLAAYQQHPAALDMATKFMNAYPEDPEFNLVAEAAIDSLSAEKQFDRVAALYHELMNRAFRRGERDRYFDYLSRLVRFHVSARALDKVVKLYWDEITAHPKDEGLYNNFLQFLASNRIYEQELLVYQRAIESFNKNDYYSKLARWYIREKKSAEFQDLTKRVADIFSESELADYFKEFLRTAKNAADPDSAFYRAMYEYANRRFPRNLEFVRGLLSYYSRFKLWEDFDELSMRYFYASETIRHNWFWRLSARGRLQALAEQLPGGGLMTGSFGAPILAGDLPASPAERLFLAEAARWNSYFEAALPVYKALAEEFLSEPSIISNLAELQRSFGDRPAAEESYRLLADHQPLEKKWPTAAGELAIERGDVDTAAADWQQIIAIAPANQESYLEVASTFWDYYRFDRARDVLLAGRAALGDPTLYGSRLAAVYESAGDYQGAVDEYIRSVALNWEDYYQRDEPFQRLVWLATKRNMDGMILTSFLKAVNDADEDVRYVQACNQFLVTMKNRTERISLLTAALSRYENTGFLSWVAAQFRGLRLPELEERTLQRIIQLEGETPEMLLELANFYERENQLDKAEAILVKRIQMTKTTEPEALPDYLGALDAAAQFAWRHDLDDKAFAWWETAGRAAPDAQRRERLHRLAGNLIARKQFDKATALLEELLKGDPAAADLFNTLADIYSLRQDYRGLAGLYTRAIETVRTREGLSAAEKLARIEELRLGMIDNLVRLGDFTAAIDQHIELINRRPENTGYIESAWRFAAAHALEERLIGFYVKTAATSSKDYRWNTVLAQLYTLQDHLEDAAAQWRLAIRNEPQRIDLRSSLADLLVKLQQYAQAIQEYREIHRLSGRDSSWLNTIAQTQAMAGDLAAARETLATILQQSPNDYSQYFAAARLLVTWGDMDSAAKMMDDGLAMLQKDLYRDPLREADLELFVETNVRRGQAVDVFNRLLALNRIYAAEASRSGNLESWKASQGQTLTFNAYSGAFAQAVQQYATNAERAAVNAALKDFLTRFPKDANTVDWVYSVAQKAGFMQLAWEATLARAAIHGGRDAAKYYQHGVMDEALQFYATHSDWADAVSLLENEATRIAKNSSETTQFLLLADIHRALGENEKEFNALRRWWLKDRQGSVNFDANSPYLERYLDLVLARNKPKELTEVTGMPFAYAGQLINALLARKRPDLALQTIDAISGSYSLAWRDSKKLLIASAAGVPLDKLGKFSSPANLMRDMPIGRRLTAPANPERSFIGDDWFSFLPHYADWLAQQKDERISSIIVGIAEGAPRDPAMQRAIGAWYVKHQRYDDAQRHYNLALQLNARDPLTFSAIGEALLKQGDRPGALAAWEKIVPEGAAGDAWENWLDVMNRNGMLEEAIPRLNSYLGSTLEVDSDWRVRSLINVYAGILAENGREAVIVDLLIARSHLVEEPIQLLAAYQSDLPVSAQQRARLLGELIDDAGRLGATATDGESEYYRYPILRNWLDTGIEFAVDEKLWDRAAKWLDLYENSGYLKDSGYLFGDESSFRRMRGKVLLALGRKDAALEAFHRALENSEYYSADDHQSVYALLRDGGAAKEARDLMIAFYRTAFAKGYDYQSYYLGYAEMLLERARDEQDASAYAEGIASLSRMVNAESNNASGMRDAAELLERFGRSGDALKFRSQLRALEPNDGDNTLKLAIAAATAGNREDALKLLRELNEHRGVKREVRIASFEPYLKLFAADAAGAKAEAERYRAAAAANELDLILQADLLERAGEQAAVKTSLDAGATTLFEPSLIPFKQARAALSAGDREAAVRYYYAALHNEARPKAFRELLRLLAEMKRNRELLLLCDQMENEGLNAATEETLSALTGLKDAGLLPIYAQLVDAAIAEKEYSLALEYEGIRVELAGRLNISVTDRGAEIEKLNEQAPGPQPPVRILESVSN